MKKDKQTKQKKLGHRPKHEWSLYSSLQRRSSSHLCGEKVLSTLWRHWWRLECYRKWSWRLAEVACSTSFLCLWSYSLFKWRLLGDKKTKTKTFLFFCRKRAQIKNRPFFFSVRPKVAWSQRQADASINGIIEMCWLREKMTQVVWRSFSAISNEYSEIFSAGKIVIKYIFW